MRKIERVRAAAALAACTAMSASVLSAQQPTPAIPQAAPVATTPVPAQPAATRPPVVAQTPPAATRPSVVAQTPPVAVAQGSRRSNVPQGFSVVLVLGDLQGASVPDDVPVAAKKALTDMRDFLPFKSYRLLDAAWLMCCGESSRPGNPSLSDSRNAATQMLRGPEGEEYELRLATSRAEGGRVFVRFTLAGSTGSAIAAARNSASEASVRTMQRRIEDLRDRSQLIQNQIEGTRRKVEVGTSAGAEIPKLEVELRSIEREIRDMQARQAENMREREQVASVVASARSAQRGGAARESSGRGSIMDTSFSMDVGETVVVGTSRLRGGSKALIALLTAVPPRK
jgi:hypothetical protein